MDSGKPRRQVRRQHSNARAAAVGRVLEIGTAGWSRPPRSYASRSRSSGNAVTLADDGPEGSKSNPNPNGCRAQRDGSNTHSSAVALLERPYVSAAHDPSLSGASTTSALVPTARLRIFCVYARKARALRGTEYRTSFSCDHHGATFFGRTEVT